MVDSGNIYANAKIWISPYGKELIYDEVGEVWIDKKSEQEILSDMTPEEYRKRIFGEDNG